MKSEISITILSIQRIGADSRQYTQILSKLPFVEKVIEADFHFRMGTAEENKRYIFNLPDSHKKYYLDNNMDPAYFIDQSLDELVDSYLSQVDMVYLPGSSFDPMAEYCVDMPKSVASDIRRELFELEIIKRAKKLGIPVLAICAGSWRLANAYGGMTETLSKDDISKHEKWESIREMTDAVKITANTMLHNIHQIAQRDRSIKVEDNGYKKELAVTPNKYRNFIADEFKVNSSHSRVTRPPELQTGTDFHRLFQTSAIDKQTKTVEAFESLHGVPMLGVQFHPEYSIPFFKRNGTGDVVEDYKTHRMLLETAVSTAQAYKSKKLLLAEFKINCSNTA